MIGNDIAREIVYVFRPLWMDMASADTIQSAQRLLADMGGYELAGEKFANALQAIAECNPDQLAAGRILALETLEMGKKESQPWLYARRLVAAGENYRSVTGEIFQLWRRQAINGGPGPGFPGHTRMSIR